MLEGDHPVNTSIPHPAGRRLPRRRLQGRDARALSIAVGAILMVAGILVVAIPLVGVVARGRADDSALSQ